MKDAGEAAHAYRTAVGLYDANAESNGTPYKLTKGHPIDAWGRATEMYWAERQNLFRREERNLYIHTCSTRVQEA